jgi:hypothetical protein
MNKGSGKTDDRRSEITHRETEGQPRGRLKEAFAGDENNGPAAHQKADHRHSTILRSRRTDSSKAEGKAPIR